MEESPSPFDSALEHARQQLKQALHQRRQLDGRIAWLREAVGKPRHRPLRDKLMSIRSKHASIDKSAAAPEQN